MSFLRQWTAARPRVALAIAATRMDVARGFSASGAPTEVWPMMNPLQACILALTLLYPQQASTKPTDWNADRYAATAGFIPEMGKEVLGLLEPMSGERILDVCCGDGVLTVALKASGCKVVAIDFAPNMVAAAVERGVEAYVMDASAIDAPFLLSKISRGNDSNNNATDMPSSPPTNATVETHAIHEDGDVPNCPPAFDAVFSNAALHWMKAPRTVIDGAKRVLRPGGRFVGEFLGHGSCTGARVAMHAALRRRGVDPLKVDPFYFPTADEYRRHLEEAGFIVDSVELYPRPTILPADAGIHGWLSIFHHAFCRSLPDNPSTELTASDDDSALDENGLTKTEAAFIDETIASMKPSLCDKEGVWTGDYMWLRFKAHTPHY